MPMEGSNQASESGPADSANTKTNRAGGFGIVAYFANNSVAANLIMGLLLIGGLISGIGLNAQVFPTLNPGIITVVVPYPGATPSEVEESITRRVEEAVIGIEGVEEVRSSAAENVGTITIELKDYVDDKEVKDDVEAAVERIADFPPENAEQPEVERAETVSDVMTLVVTSQRDEMSLRVAAESLVENLLTLPNVTLVSLMGARDLEISVEVSEQVLRQYDLSIDQVASAIRQSSINLSAGELRTDAGDLLLRTNQKRMFGEEFEDIVLRAEPDGSILRLSDVANIRDGFVDEDVIQAFNGQQSLLVKIQKSETEDALAIAAQLKDFLGSYQAAEGMAVDIWDDQTDILEQRLSLLVRNGLLGFALVFMFLVIMLDLRLATWVAMGVPISFLGALLFFAPFGVNINMISLFGLIIVLGIVVDDAVVVGENIITEQEKHGLNAAATLQGVRGVFSPVTIGVLTTMAAFAPLLFVTGPFGQILGSVPIVVILVLTISLVEVFFILPAHLAHGRAWSVGPLRTFQDAVSRKVMVFRDQVFLPRVGRAVERRYFSFLCGICMLVVAGALVSSGAVRFIFFPDLESNSIRASLTFPVGTPFQTTEIAANRIIAAAYAVNDKNNGTAFKSISATIGGASRSGGGPGKGSGMTTASHLSSIAITLQDEPLRTLSAGELERQWRQVTGDIAGVESLSFRSGFFSQGSAVEFRLAHQDDEVLYAAVDDLKQGYAGITGFYDIQDTFNLGKRQFDVELTPAGEAAGLLPGDIARQLRNNFFGQEVQRIQRGRNELKVMVRYPEYQRQSTQNLERVRIRLQDGTQTPLSTVARLKESRSFSTIERVDGLRIVSVTSEVDKELITPTQANNEVLKNVVPDLLARYPGLQANQAGQGRDESDDMASLGRMMAVAMLTIFVLLASQTRSYIQPLVVLAGVPFGAAGAVIGHFLLGYNISFISIFGMVALSGVVVNDSLVLVDQYNRNRNAGKSVHDAIVEASQRRFRAIFLTTATTALGLTPMLFETSTQAQFLIPMAVSLASGIVFASVIILFLIPALVVIMEDFKSVVSPAAQPRLQAG